MKKKIFVIDDDEGILSAFEALLTDEGYSVKATSSVDVLLLLTKNNYPDLILLDVLLSGVDGRDICKQLKQQPSTEHIPIIMISAHPSANNSIKEAGADDFIIKPFEMEELMTKINRQLSLKK